MNKQISWEPFEIEEEGEYNPGMLMSSSSMNSNINEYEDFNLFICHCNFKVTRYILVFLCDVEGVESIDLLSPYRLRIGVAKLFAVQTVLDNIETGITGDEIDGSENASN